MARIAHLSDLHFPRVAAEAVDVLLQDLHEWQPDLVAISGDFVQSGAVAEFRHARAFLDRVPSPCLTVPGNHDIPSLQLVERFSRPFARYRRYIHPDLSPVFETAEFVAAGVNTARPFGPYWDWSRGRISVHQLDFLQRTFAAAERSKVRVVIAHHPFLLNAETLHRRLVGRSRQALGMFEKANVDLLLAGHLHRSLTGLVAAPRRGASGGSPMVAVQAATALSTRLKNREANAYHRIRLSRDRILIEPWHWDGRARFQAGPPSRYERTGHRWRAAVPERRRQA